MSRTRVHDEGRDLMVVRSSSVNMYEFVVVSALRTHQLMSGCVPRVGGGHKATTVAQMEVATGKVARVGALQLHEALKGS